MLFKTRISELLQEHGLRQAELCRMTGIPTSLMSNYVKGKASPTLPNAQAIADAFGVTLDELVGRVAKSEVMCETQDEEVLLKMFRELDEEDRRTIVGHVEYLHHKKFQRDALSREAGETG